MRLYPLALLAFEIIQVNSHIFGARIPGDHLLSYQVLNNPATSSYPPSYPVITRPEIINYLVIIDIRYPSSPFTIDKGGVNFKYYFISLYPGRSYSFEAWGKAPQETLTSGDLSISDSLMYMETITKPASQNKIKVVNLKYPVNIKPGATLTWISAMDHNRNDSASVRIVNGGVGFQRIHLQMRSRVGEGLNFTVQMYYRNVTGEDWPWYFSYNAATDRVLFQTYWPWVSDVSRSASVEKTCGCKSGRMLTTTQP